MGDVCIKKVFPQALMFLQVNEHRFLTAFLIDQKFNPGHVHLGLPSLVSREVYPGVFFCPLTSIHLPKNNVSRPVSVRLRENPRKNMSIWLLHGCAGLVELLATSQVLVGKAVESQHACGLRLLSRRRGAGETGTRGDGCGGIQGEGYRVQERHGRDCYNRPTP